MASKNFNYNLDKKQAVTLIKDHATSSSPFSLFQVVARIRSYGWMVDILCTSHDCNKVVDSLAMLTERSSFSTRIYMSL
ncbi:hypothetical protein GQ457_03G013230 [Hibiscus cannabinus]